MDKVKQVVAEVESRLGDNGHVLLRKPGTEPLIRVKVQATNAQTAEAAAANIANVSRKSVG